MRYLVGFLLVLTSCTNEPLNEKSFIWADDMNADKERIFESPEIENKINLDDFEIGARSNLKTNTEKLFISATGLRILVIDKADPEDNYILEIPKGRGPGEVVSFVDYEVYKNRIYIADRGQHKFLIIDLDGNMLQEFIFPEIYIEEIAIIDEETILCYAMGVNEHIFTILNTKGDIVKSIVKSEPDLNIMMYTGEIHAEEKNIYFSGYSEPIIKKFSIGEEGLKFSVEVIDSYESANNYMFRADGNSPVQGFTEDALYNTRGITVFNDMVFNVPRHNGRAGYKYADMYSIEDGEYVKSFELYGYPATNGIQIDSNYIYSLEMDSSRTNLLVMYKNNF